MPTTSPQPKPRDRSEYMRQYRAKNRDKLNQQNKEYAETNRDKLRLLKREWRNKQLAEARRKTAEANRKRGHKPRPVGDKRQTRINVGKTRRWLVVANKIYFNREIGFELSELRSILKDANAIIDAQNQL